MRLSLIIIASLLTAAGCVAQAPSAQESVANDPYQLATVKEIIAMAQKQPGIVIGSLQKFNNQLGDRAAIAIIKIYTPEKLTQPGNVAMYLPILRAAFAYPRVVFREEDKEPRVTLVLLDWLERRVMDPKLKREIVQLTTDLRRQSATSEGG